METHETRFGIEDYLAQPGHDQDGLLGEERIRGASLGGGNRVARLPDVRGRSAFHRDGVTRHSVPTASLGCRAPTSRGRGATRKRHPGVELTPRASDRRGLSPSDIVFRAAPDGPHPILVRHEAVHLVLLAASAGTRAVSSYTCRGESPQPVAETIGSVPVG